MKIRSKLSFFFGIFSFLLIVTIYIAVRLSITNSFVTYATRQQPQRIGLLLSEANSNIDITELNQIATSLGLSLIPYDESKTTVTTKGTGIGRMSAMHSAVIEDSSGQKYTIQSVNTKMLTPNEENLLKEIDLYTAIIGIVFLILSQILAFIISKNFSKPIEEIISSTEKIADGNYGLQLKSKTKTEELKQLATSVSDMSKKLKENLDYSKRYNQDVQHELRTPLTNLISHIEAIQDGIYEVKEDTFDSLHSETMRLSSIVDRIQLLEKIESDNKNTKYEAIETKTFIQDLLNQFLPEANKKNIVIKSNLEEYFFNTNKELFSSCIDNLISNAIKYSGNNSEITVNSFTKEKNYVVEVIDNGTGIDKTNIPFIFDRFYRTDKSRSSSTGGSGLGLSIVKAACTALGGSVHVESIPNQKTIFTLIFNIK